VEEAMNEISNLAGVILSGIQESADNGGLNIRDISKITERVEENIGQINCYPSVTKGNCCEVAFFIALKGSSYARGQGHLSCRKAMEKIVQHMQGTCCDYTKQAVLITANWDEPAYSEWKANLNNIQGKVQLEVYLLSGHSGTRIYI